MNLKVLCIDDSKSIHAFLRECLKDISSDFTSLYNGQEGIDFLSNKSHEYDIVFLDWEMPLKIGPEVLAEAKKLNIIKPIIMLTSKNQMSDIEQVMSLGAAEYIMKPFTKDIILEKINMVLRLHQ
jgi:two-component system chemotaxis response regulator CheY